MDSKALLAQRVEDLNQNIRALLAVYMQWYTFYWTMNLAALAWIWESLASGAGKASVPADVVLWFFAVMALPAAASSAFILYAVRGMCTEIQTLNEMLIEEAGITTGDKKRKALVPAPWPLWATTWGLGVNCGATFFLGLLWGYLAVS